MIRVERVPPNGITPTPDSILKHGHRLVSENDYSALARILAQFKTCEPRNKNITGVALSRLCLFPRTHQIYQ